MKKVAIIGFFKNGKNVSDGQGVKTKILTEELERVLGSDNIIRIDTYNWQQNPFKLFVLCATSVYKCSNVIFLTDEGGIKVFPFLLQALNIIKKCKIHYYVVGGWLNCYLSKSNWNRKIIKKLDAVYVELPSMYKELQNMGFENVILVNKFRRMVTATVEEIELNPQEPYKLCYFSRVMKEKGVEEAIGAVINLNQKEGTEKYALDIWGPINDSYKEEFDVLIRNSPSFVKYCGVVDFKNSTATLKNYHAMLFPTYYKSEGYPNAIVDAFAAGLPVITTRWNYNTDVINHLEDGILVDVCDVNQISDAVKKVFDTPEIYKRMRINCIMRCEEYLPQNAILRVLEQLK